MNTTARIPGSTADCQTRPAPRILFLLTALLINCCHGADIPIGRISSTSYGDWITTGSAFNSGPVTDDMIRRLEIENADDLPVISSEVEGDLPIGTLSSPEFRISLPYISFRIGGGDYERHSCLDLLVDNKIVKSTTGRNSDHLIASSWDVRKFIGKTSRLRVTDEASGPWGHINVARILQTDSPEVMPLEKEPLYQESARPLFHFTARQWTMDRLNPGMRQDGWLNDLNGMVYHEGEYHLFAQRWNKCWIHAISRDLIHWEELEPAFWEEKLDSAVQSGTCVIDYNNTSGLAKDKENAAMVAFWSRNSPDHCISYSLDRGRTWRHYDRNPVLTFPERDPKVFWYEPSKHWVMIVYGNGQYHVFTSKNLLNWNNSNNPIDNAFECPDFFELPVEGEGAVKKWVLLHADGKYSLGTFNGTRFTEETPRYLSDAGGENFYATQTFDNTDKADGRRIQMAWIRGTKFKDTPFSQQVSFPCEITLHRTPGGLRLFRQPIREVEHLHASERKWRSRILKAGDSLELTNSGDAFRIQAEVEIPEGSRLSFNLRGFPVVFSSQSMDAGTGPHPAQTTIRSLEILVDRASVESFANGGELSCTRFFQPKEEGLSLKADGDTVVIHSIAVYPLKSMWPAVPPE